MGFRDSEFDKIKDYFKQTELYTMAGNSIVVDVAEELLCMLFDAEGNLYIWRKGDVMKKILFGWIEQIVQFDSEKERQEFIDKTEGLKVVDSFKQDGKYNLHVKRPYNNNKMKWKDGWKMSYSQRLKQAMEERNMSQAELSALTGIGKSSISQYLSGKNEPKPKATEKIAEALEVSVAFLNGLTTCSDSGATRKIF